MKKKGSKILNDMMLNIEQFQVQFLKKYHEGIFKIFKYLTKVGTSTPTINGLKVENIYALGIHFRF